MSQIFKGIIFIAVLMLLAAVNVKADSLCLGAWSHHFTAPKDTRAPLPSEYTCDAPGKPCGYWSPKQPELEYNNQHNLIAYERNSWGIGYFKNSFYEDTVFVSKQFHLKDFGYLSVSGNLGANYGYRGCGEYNIGNRTVCPQASIELAYTKYQLEPVVNFTHAGVITIGTKWKF